MGDVAVVMKVMPEDTETDLDALEDALKDAVDVQDLEREEVAFGLQAVKFSTVVADGEGGTDAIEEAVRTLDGVRSAEIVDLNRL